MPPSPSKPFTSAATLTPSLAPLHGRSYNGIAEPVSPGTRSFVASLASAGA